jgi:hypothetical protein
MVTASHTHCNYCLCVCRRQGKAVTGLPPLPTSLTRVMRDTLSGPRPLPRHATPSFPLGAVLAPRTLSTLLPAGEGGAATHAQQPIGTGASAFTQVRDRGEGIEGDVVEVLPRQQQQQQSGEAPVQHGEYDTLRSEIEGLPKDVREVFDAALAVNTPPNVVTMALQGYLRLVEGAPHGT